MKLDKLWALLAMTRKSRERNTNSLQGVSDTEQRRSQCEATASSRHVEGAADSSTAPGEHFVDIDLRDHGPSDAAPCSPQLGITTTSPAAGQLPAELFQKPAGSLPRGVQQRLASISSDGSVPPTTQVRGNHQRQAEEAFARGERELGLTSVQRTEAVVPEGTSRSTDGEATERTTGSASTASSCPRGASPVERLSSEPAGRGPSLVEMSTGPPARGRPGPAGAGSSNVAAAECPGYSELAISSLPQDSERDSRHAGGQPEPERADGAPGEPVSSHGPEAALQAAVGENRDVVLRPLESEPAAEPRDMGQQKKGAEEGLTDESIPSWRNGSTWAWFNEPMCRICQAGAAEEPLISLGCRCRGELGSVHRSCIDEWFCSKGSNVCEICHETATNVEAPPPRPDQMEQSVEAPRPAVGRGGRDEIDSPCLKLCWLTAILITLGLILDVAFSLVLGAAAIPVAIMFVALSPFAGVLIICSLVALARISTFLYDRNIVHRGRQQRQGAPAEPSAAGHNDVEAQPRTAGDPDEPPNPNSSPNPSPNPNSNPNPSAGSQV